MAALSAVFAIALFAFSIGSVYSDTGVYIATDASTGDNTVSGNMTYDSGSGNAYFIGDTIIAVRGDSSSQQFDDSDGIVTRVTVNLAPRQIDGSTVVLLSDGRNATLLVTPLDASVKAQSELSVSDCKMYCELSLKEQRVQGESRAVYEVKARKKAHVFGVIPARLQTTTNIDAETGTVINTHSSWWSFLARSDTEAETYSYSGTN